MEDHLKLQKKSLELTFEDSNLELQRGRNDTSKETKMNMLVNGDSKEEDLKL